MKKFKVSTLGGLLEGLNENLCKMFSTVPGTQ